MTGGLNRSREVTPIVSLEISQRHANERTQVLDVRQARCLADEIVFLAANGV